MQRWGNDVIIFLQGQDCGHDLHAIWRWTQVKKNFVVKFSFTLAVSKYHIPDFQTTKALGTVHGKLI